MTKRRSTVTVEGRDYEVVDRLGYGPDGNYAVEVRCADGAHRVAAWRSPRGPWEWYKPLVLPRNFVVGQAEGGAK